MSLLSGDFQYISQGQIEQFVSGLSPSQISSLFLLIFSSITEIHPSVFPNTHTSPQLMTVIFIVKEPGRKAPYRVST